MVPDGAEAFKGKLSQAISVTCEREGVYGYRCLPHYAIGMVGVVVIGDPSANVEAAKAVKLPAKASTVMAELLARARSEENTSELQSLMRISYSVFCLNKNTGAKTICYQYNTNMHR